MPGKSYGLSNLRVSVDIVVGAVPDKVPTLSPKPPLYLASVRFHASILAQVDGFDSLTLVSAQTYNLSQRHG